MSEPPSKRARTEDEQSDVGDSTRELGVLGLSTKRDILRAVYGEPPAFALKNAERIPVARMINVPELKACVTELEKAHAEAIAAAEADAELAHEKRTKNIANYISLRCGDVTDVKVNMGFVDGSEPRFGEVIVTAGFDVEFTRRKTQRRHHLSLDLSLRVTLKSTGCVSYDTEHADVHEDLLAHNVLYTEREVELLVCQICIALGMRPAVTNHLYPAIHQME